MTLLYPVFLWLLIPLGLLFWIFKPKSLMQTVHLLILGLLIISLARPRLPRGIQEQHIDAKDVLIALDVSYSMRARDLKPDRYTYAKDLLNALLEKNAKDNIMLIAFTSNPLLLSPPTTDHHLIQTALNALEPGNIMTKGTSLEKLFKKIASLTKTEREVLLITDGGEEKDLQKLLDALKESSVHLIILAMGTDKGATIPTEKGTMLTDKAGHLVISRINPLLRRLSDATGGEYLTASDSPQKDADVIAEVLEDTAKQSQQISKLHHTYTELYWITLLFAAALFIMLHTRASRYLLLFFSLAGVQLQAGMFEGITLQKVYTAYGKGAYNRAQRILNTIETPSLQQRYALASTYYRLGNYKKARQLFSSIRTTSPLLKQKLYYNIANTYAMEGTYDKARIYYTKALQLAEDADAAQNLALVMHLKNRHEAQLGITRPKSQSVPSSKAVREASSNNTTGKREEDQASSGAGSGGRENRTGKKEETQKGRLKLDENASPQPLSSKVYELINEGYIRETQPW